MGDVNPQESERIPLKPREIAQAITRGNSLPYSGAVEKHFKNTYLIAFWKITVPWDMLICQRLIQIVWKELLKYEIVFAMAIVLMYFFSIMILKKSLFALPAIAYDSKQFFESLKITNKASVRWLYPALRAICIDSLNAFAY